MVKKMIIVFVFFLLATVLSQKTYAVIYDLTAPTGQLKRGDQVQFKVYINTEGTTVTKGEIGMTYETQYLEYVSTSPGVAMSPVTVTPQGTGKFLLTGTNSSGFSGNDVFANVNFKIIAQAPGSTQLCALWAPEVTPTVAPTAPPGSTNTPTPAIPIPTSPNVPTALPKTGDTRAQDQVGKIGGIFVVIAVGLFALKKLIL